MGNVSNTGAGLGLSADPEAVAAATAARAGARSSRDVGRDAEALVVSASTVGNEKAAQARARADKAAAAKAAQAKAAAVAKAKAEADKRAIALARRWVNPVSGYKLTSGYGFRWGKMHPAQDLAAPSGTPVHSLSTGRVVFAGWSNEGYGYLVKVRYWDGSVSWMAHNSRLLVSVGQAVVPGQTLAYSGNTGNSTGPHVHLEIHPGDGSAVVPTMWLAARGVTL